MGMQLLPIESFQELRLHYKRQGSVANDEPRSAATRVVTGAQCQSPKGTGLER